MKAFLKVSIIALFFMLINTSGCMKENSNEGIDDLIFDKGIVSFRLDDNLVSQYNYRYIFESRNIRATLMVNPGLLGKIGEYSYSGNNKVYMTWDQLIEMHSNGWEVANHTYEHTILRNLSKARAEEAITKAIDAFKSKGITDVVSFGFPNSMNDRVGVKASKKYYKISSTLWARSEYPYGLECGSEEIVPKNIMVSNEKFPRLLPVTFIDGHTLNEKVCGGTPGEPAHRTKSIRTIRSLVDKAYEEKRWLIIGLHDIVNGCTRTNWGFELEDAALEDLLDYIKSKGMPILTMRDAWNYYDRTTDHQ
jgi:peptidoglycan/xylan/chitin deacetylase (PgdA/CDA1 family)